MENQDSKANSVGRVNLSEKLEKKNLPNDFMNNHFNELERERKMVEYFDHANLDIRLFTHCIDIAKLCNSKYESITELNSMNPMRAFTLLSLSDSRKVMEQSGYWNGGSLPKSQERWELLNALDSIEPAKLEELLMCKFKAVKEHNETSTIKIFAGLEYVRFNLQFGESVNKLPVALQWIDFLKEVAEGRELSKPVVNFSTQSQEIKNGTGLGLTLWQASYLLAYRREVLEDPRNRENMPANTFALELCGRNAPNSGYMLYQNCTHLRSATDRERFFKSALDAFKEGNKWHDKSPKSFLKDIETIIQHLQGKKKTEAENDLKRWNTMVQHEAG
jgi:hypothetical protein